jgi:hypothetical protein
MTMCIDNGSVAATTCRCDIKQSAPASNVDITNLKSDKNRCVVDDCSNRRHQATAIYAASGRWVNAPALNGVQTMRQIVLRAQHNETVVNSRHR